MHDVQVGFLNTHMASALVVENVEVSGGSTSDTVDSGKEVVNRVDVGCNSEGTVLEGQMTGAKRKQLIMRFGGVALWGRLGMRVASLRLMIL
ncbi:hypothetical protein Q3G72_012535 [Acer saccharum]|nr:hypothetical protein Q3G72_012535 [Acer saccharum]